MMVKAFYPVDDQIQTHACPNQNESWREVHFRNSSREKALPKLDKCYRNYEIVEEENGSVLEEDRSMHLPCYGGES